MAWDISDITIGDEVTITATILKLLDYDGRASISIPSYGFPYSIRAPKKAKPGGQVELTGEVTRIDEGAGLVTVKLGIPVTVDVSAITRWTPAVREHRGKPLRDTPD
ncbi:MULTISPECIES: hypothetical protein [unclassified Mesorhizobium]|uniref:hypothetical protein n=1 Tax=unclassified Mesorhizobium TaxID=325217 RepID=UPI000FCCB54E|nr:MULTISPECIES: hypothetical protein [unclassified Mesorhizobium]RUV47490.1 hypothetical protein EOA85_34385 [Mesorhizobium sp. M5C.F.Ca.IN.020.29.1.1]TIM56012.1 MAG: hypothetical protein E5Y46_15435 [Mesorhizobium sp.]TIM86935.1 MAG: hypothetical protein E5Y50_13825 [Mesorhizobium sp.]TIR28877.1 MAG: hypothetical protein E5X35_28915 [Mesorhizobium sp.]TIS20453.1 MAG: hypothetical protein E5X07_25385 [Mesorhizobium sp.]